MRRSWLTLWFIFCPFLIKAEYWLFYGEYEFAFEGTRQQLYETRPPVIPLYTGTAREYITGTGYWNNNTNPQYFHLATYYYYSTQSNQSISETMGTAVSRTEQEFNEYIAQNGLILHDGFYINSEHIPDLGPETDSNSDGVPDTVAQALGAGDAFLSLGSANLSESEVRNQSPEEKIYRLELLDASGDPAFVLDEFSLGPSDPINGTGADRRQLADYGQVPEGFDLLLTMYDTSGNLQQSETINTSGLPPSNHDLFTNGSFIPSQTSDGVPISTPNFTPEPLGTASSEILNFDQAFQDWVDYHTSPGTGTLPTNGVSVSDIRAGVQAAAPAITGPIVQSISSQTETLESAISESSNSIVEAVNGLNANLSGSFSPGSGSTMNPAEIDSLIQDMNSEHDSEMESAIPEPSTVSTSILNVLDTLFISVSEIVESFRTALESVSAIFDVSGSASSLFVILPANIIFGNPELSIDLNSGPTSTLKNVLSAAFGFLWAFTTFTLTVKSIKWALQ